MQIDGPELYPPDSTDNSPEARSVRNRSVAGVFLVVWGSGLLASRMFHIHNLDYTGLAIGLAVLAGWNQMRRYIWFVIGAVLTGAGLGGLISNLIGGGAVSSAVGAFGVAAGFAACYVRYPTRSTWALIPAGIFGVIGVGSLGLGIAGLIGAHLAGFLMPGLLISAGLLLVARGSIPRKTRRIALICMAGAFLLLLSSSVDGRDNNALNRHFGPLGAPGVVSVHETEQPELPSLAGKTLIIAAGAGNITVDTGTTASATIERTVTDRRQSLVNLRLQNHFRARQVGDNKVELSQDRVPGVGASEGNEFRITVPSGTDLLLTTGSGTITADVIGGTIRFETNAGDILVTGSPTSTTLQTLSGDISLDEATAETAGVIDLKTSAGSVTAKLAGHPAADVTTRAGTITIDGDERPGEHVMVEGENEPANVKILTKAGDVILTRRGSSSATTTTAKG
jgi:hypothetical protein